MGIVYLEDPRSVSFGKGLVQLTIESLTKPHPHGIGHMRSCAERCLTGESEGKASGSRQ